LLQAFDSLTVLVRCFQVYHLLVCKDRVKIHNVLLHLVKA
jgi:hypothetical protein